VYFIEAKVMKDTTRTTVQLQVPTFRNSKTDNFDKLESAVSKLLVCLSSIHLRTIALPPKFGSLQDTPNHICNFYFAVKTRTTTLRRL